MKNVKMEIWRVEETDDLVLCGEAEEDLKRMVGYFDDICKKKGLKVSADKSKVMVLGGKSDWSVRSV